MNNIFNILDSIEEKTSYKSKQNLLEIGITDYPNFEKYLRMTFNDNVFNLDSKSIEKYLSITTKQPFKDIGEKLQFVIKHESKNKSLISDVKEKTFEDFEIFYKSLLNRDSQQTKQLLNDFFYNCDPVDAKWYVRCIVKNLSSKVSLSTTNKILEKCHREPIKTFGVQLAEKISYGNRREEVENLLKEHNYLWVENKEDGVRAYFRNTNPLNNYKWEGISRNGKPILNISNILYELERIFGDTPCEIDGEYIADNFYSLSTTIHSKNNTQNIIPRTLQVFDITYYKEDISNKLFKDRREILVNVLKDKSDIVNIATSTIHTNVDTILKYFDRQVEKGEEGIIIKTNSPYTRKREHFYKIKPTHTLDLELIGFEYATDGKNVGQRNVVIVKDKSGILESKVGSGLSDSDIELFSMGEEKDWIGKIIEVKFDSITPLKNGKRSLRFPRYIRIRDDKNEIDNIEQ